MAAPVLQTTVTIDPYIPLIARTYEAPIGAVIWRTGNFKTSLVEIAMEPESGIVRGLKLVLGECNTPASFRLGPEVVQGLPVVRGDHVPSRMSEECRDLNISISEGNIFIDWCLGGKIDQIFTSDRLSFYVGNNELLGASVGRITPDEKKAFLSRYL